MKHDAGLHIVAGGFGVSAAGCLACDALAMFTIYDHPSDIPTGFVVREWMVVRGGAIVDGGVVIVSDTLAGAREAVPPGLARLGRNPDDDPTVVETWV